MDFFGVGWLLWNSGSFVWGRLLPKVQPLTLWYTFEKGTSFMQWGGGAYGPQLHLLHKYAKKDLGQFQAFLTACLVNVQIFQAKPGEIMVPKGRGFYCVFLMVSDCCLEYDLNLHDKNYLVTFLCMFCRVFQRI